MAPTPTLCGPDARFEGQQINNTRCQDGSLLNTSQRLARAQILTGNPPLSL